MTTTVGIIGHPLHHSISPTFQQAAFDHYGLDVRYMAWDTPPEGLARRIEALRSSQVLGANVTVPYKEAVIPYLDRLTVPAQDMGAVNTIVGQHGILEGHNTDVTGFLQALKENGGFQPQGKRVLLLGAGGAARAAAHALVGAGVGSLTIANRTVERGHRLITALGDSCILEAITMEPFSLASRNGWDLIVNCTTLGMRYGPDEGKSPMPETLIPSNALVYDLVYNPQETPLLQQAKKIGARTLGGLPMLVYQGADAFQLWTEREAPLPVMLKAAHQALVETKGYSP